MASDGQCCGKREFWDRDGKSGHPPLASECEDYKVCCAPVPEAVNVAASVGDRTTGLEWLGMASEEGCRCPVFKERDGSEL